jgi:hypothetical protein
MLTIDRIDETMRGANGRFLPGRSGNPAGRKKGTRNRAALYQAILLRLLLQAAIREASRAQQGDSAPAFRLHQARRR